MQNLNHLLQAASVIQDIARHKQTHTLPILSDSPIFYLHTDDAAVRIVRWERHQAEITIETRFPFAWRVATDYDENGVYVVAIKRPGFGTLASGAIHALIPMHTHLVLRMNGGLLSLDHVRGTLDIAPPKPAPHTDGYLTDGISKSNHDV